MSRLCLCFTATTLFMLMPATSLAQTARSTSDAIRDAQTKATSVREKLTRVQNDTSSLIESTHKIDVLGDKKGELQTSVSTAKVIARAVGEALVTLSGDSAQALEQQRLLDSHLDDALASIQATQKNESLMKQVDNALTPTLAATLAAASLTLAGLLLGLGMPLLLSKYTVSKTPGADKQIMDFRIAVANAGMSALWGFAFFAVAILENVTIGSSDWAILANLELNTRLYLDVGTEMSFLVGGIIFLIRAAYQLRVQVKMLKDVWINLAK